MPSNAVNESCLPRLTSATVISLCLLLCKHPPQGCASKKALLFFYPFSHWFGLKTKGSKKKKGSYLWQGKGFNLRSQSKETEGLFSSPLPHVSPFFRAPGGNAQWAACLCCCVPTLCRASLLSEATQHGAKGHVGMPIMQCGNCDCFWFKWFQMRIFEVHSEKQLAAVAIDIHKKSVDAVP